jgi:hypothetical protein
LPKVKGVSLPPVRVSEKLKEQTEMCADLEQENVSEYVRRAVELRNRRVVKENSKNE